MTRSAGYHGKIPTQGDFIQRGLPLGFTRAWDRWLMEGIAALKTQRGDGWLDGYRTAPLWRFATPAGAFGEQAMLGVMVASVDRVGRNFPLTLAAEAPPGCSPIAALLAEAELLERMAAVAQRTISESVRKDALDAAVEEIRPNAAAQPHVEETGEALTVRGPNPEGAIAARWLERRYGPESSIFISDAGADGERRLIATRGAPRPSLVAQLFEGGGQPAPPLFQAEDDLGLLAPMEADVVAPVAAMTAAVSDPRPASDDEIDALLGDGPLSGEETPPAPAAAAVDLPAELDPDFDPSALPDPFDPNVVPDAPATRPATPPRPATDDDIDALIGSDPLSGDEPPPPPKRPAHRDTDEDDDPIAAILAGGGPES